MGSPRAGSNPAGCVPLFAEFCFEFTTFCITDTAMVQQAENVALIVLTMLNPLGIGTKAQPRVHLNPSQGGDIKNLKSIILL